jgi:hypothetical protein
VRVEVVDGLGVEQSNNPRGVPLLAMAVGALDIDGSNTFAGDFVKYGVLTSRFSRTDPLKCEAHLGPPRGYYSPQPLPLIYFLYAARQFVAISYCAPFQSEVAGADHNRQSALKIVFHVRVARADPRLEHQIAKIERGPPEIKWHDVIELVVSRVDTNRNLVGTHQTLGATSSFDRGRQAERGAGRTCNAQGSLATALSLLSSY